MSLINQALKLEQQRRHTDSSPVPPMVSRLSSQRHTSSRWPMILLGMTGMGALLAISLTAIFYFGSDYLNKDDSSLALSIPNSELPDSEATTAATGSVTKTAASGNPDEIEALLGTLSSEELTTVQQMLLEREAAKKSENQENVAIAKASSPEQAAPQIDLATLSKIQETVDGFTVQGIRKAGKDSRVFLNGKIQRIGDVVEIENNIVLAGFTETALVFKIPSGHAFKKPL